MSTNPDRKPKRKKSREVEASVFARYWYLFVGGASIVAVMIVTGLALAVWFLTPPEPQAGKPVVLVAAKDAVGEKPPTPLKDGIAPPKDGIPPPKDGAPVTPKLEIPPPVILIPPPMPELPPLTEAEKRLRAAFNVQLGVFGPARFENPQFEGRTWTAVVVEVDGLAPDAIGRFEAATVTAQGAAGADVKAAVVFVAGGRDGLAMTARILAGSIAKRGDICVGSERFLSWPVGTFGRSSIEANGGEEVARVHVKPNETSVRGSDFVLAMPMILETGGGVEYGFVPGKKVRIGFLFAAPVENLARVQLLGHRLELAPAKRAGELLAKGPPQPFDPKVDTRPPIGEKPVPKDDPLARVGWWAVPAVDGEPRLLFEQGDHLGSALSRDLKQIAVLGRAKGKDGKGKTFVGTEMQLAVGPLAKPLKAIWTGPAELPELVAAYPMTWSPDGQRVLFAGRGGAMLVGEVKGKFKILGTPSGSPPPVETRAGVIGAWPLATESARWAGRDKPEIAVVARGLPSLLVALNPATGQKRELCELPQNLPFVSIFQISDDLNTVLLLDKGGGPDKGIWILRRGPKAPPPFRLVAGAIDTAGLSPDGKHVVVTINNLKGNIRRTALYQLATKQEVWSAPLAASGFAFDRAGKQLAIATASGQLLVTPLTQYEPAELIKGSPMPIENPFWSADGKEIAFRRAPAQ